MGRRAAVRMKILVIDGQGGGVGSQCIAQLKAEKEPDWEIWAVGSNSMATSAMLKAGADAAATGESAVVYNAQRADVIVGPMGIAFAHSMMGEISPAMAAAVSGSEAKKLLIPMMRCHVQVMGVSPAPLSAYIAEAVAQLHHGHTNRER